MLSIDIPGHGVLELEYLLLDLNGTIAHDGALLPGVAAAIAELGRVLEVVLVTADTHGRGREIAEELAIELRVIERGREADSKLDLVDELGAEKVAAIGNGANDALMLRDAALGIAVVGGEGASGSAVAAADVVTTGIEAALGLLLEPPRLIATLRV